MTELNTCVLLLYPLLAYIQVTPAHSSALLEKGSVCVLDEHLNIFIEPGPSAGSSLHTTLAVTLTTGLDPGQGIDVGVVTRRAPRRGSEARGRHIAPLAPLLPGTRKGYPPLIDNELRGLRDISIRAYAQRVCSTAYQALSLEERRERQGVVTLVPRVGELGEVLTDSGVEGVVVGDVGREAADLLAFTGESDDLGELLGG